ncbi:MAG: hypothetical protein HC915_00715 [Anaerolineae bacterium]|nr:hypothetical protein [Anaerolineae bacterium]
MKAPPVNFLPFDPARLDARLITLQEGLEYPNPLVIQVVLQGLDPNGRQLTIRASTVLPLATADLGLTLQGPATLVRGDFGIPIFFTFTNISPDEGTGASGRILDNVQVMSLLEPINGPNVGRLPQGLGFDEWQDANPNNGFRLCTFDVNQATELDGVQPEQTFSGVCTFDFQDIIEAGTTLRYEAAIKADVIDINTGQPTGETAVDLGVLEIAVVPHLLLEKIAGFEQALPDDLIPYSITVVNQSEYQHVDFPTAVENEAFTDVFTPALQANQICVPDCNSTPRTANLLDFTGDLEVSPGNVRLLPSGRMELFYEVQPPPLSGVHEGEQYTNVATVRGERQSDDDIVTASDSARVEFGCPISVFSSSTTSPRKPRIPMASPPWAKPCALAS